MYKNIIFDIGGVLINFHPRDFLLDHFFSEAIENKVYAITFGSEEWSLLDAGMISRYEANKRMLERGRQEGCEFEVQTVIDDWTTMLTTRQKTAQILALLKMRGYRIYYLTNMPADLMVQLRQRPFWKMFDGGVASCDVHRNKPDPEIFRILMSKYGLAYEETIFIDDSRANAQAAFDLGLTGILYKGNRSLIRALESCGVQATLHRAKPKNLSIPKEKPQKEKPQKEKPKRRAAIKKPPFPRHPKKGPSGDNAAPKNAPPKEEST